MSWVGIGVSTEYVPYSQGYSNSSTVFMVVGNKDLNGDIRLILDAQAEEGFKDESKVGYQTKWCDVVGRSAVCPQSLDERRLL